MALLTTPGYQIAAEDACCPGGRSAEAVYLQELSSSGVLTPLRKSKQCLGLSCSSAEWINTRLF